MHAAAAAVRRSWWLARPYRELRVSRLLRSDAGADVREFAASVRRNTVAIDVGANVGNHAIAAARRVGRDGLVLALEPNPDVYRELLNATRGARVVGFPFAASDVDGWLDLHVPLSPTGAMHAQLGSIEQRTADVDGSILPLRVPATRLDSVVPANWRVSVVKIDVEGHESSVIRGARTLLDRQRPTLVVEIEQRHLPSPTAVEDVVGQICALGYDCEAITSRGVVPWDDFDVERDQLRWLTGSVATPVEHGAPYVNNFKFLSAD